MLVLAQLIEISNANITKEVLTYVLGMRLEIFDAHGIPTKKHQWDLPPHVRVESCTKTAWLGG